jgi:hypothetical protein
VAVLGIAVVGTWRYIDHVNHRPERQIHDTAVADAAKKVDDVLDRFHYDYLYRADEYAHTAGQYPDVRILSVTGRTHWRTGVTLVLEVTGHGVVVGADRSVIRERNVPVCFRLHLGPHDDSRDDGIDCPAGTPVPIAQDPSLHDVDDRLQRALDSAGPNEPAVRAAVAGLNLDSAIHQDVVSHDGIVGVALRATQYDCIVARVTSEGAQLWRPSHTQLAPGELTCSAGIALSREFRTFPH